MPRINVIDRISADEATKGLLNKIEGQLGTVPNIFLTMAQSPSTLDAYLKFSGTLAGGKLCPKLREKIALAVAGKNGCDYCASAHTLLGGKAGIDPEELKLNICGEATDPKSKAVLEFVSVVIENKGQVGNEQLNKLAEVGLTQEEVIEVVGHIAMNVFTNYFNNIVGTDIDFPLVSTASEKACSA